jgi:signal transduction histidine kinase
MDREKRPNKPVEALGKMVAEYTIVQDMESADGAEQDKIRRLPEVETKHVELTDQNMTLERKVRERTAELTRTIAALENEVENRRQIGVALQKSQEKLRDLSRQILKAQENERKLIAQNIHDSVSGSLAAIKLAMEEKINSNRSKLVIEVSWLETIISYLDETIKESRQISAQLRPSLLDDLGLLSTISWFCREFEQMHSNIEIERRLDVAEEEIPETEKVIVYRVFQEAMNNVAKHSGATQVLLELVKTDDRIEFKVADNGCGFDADEKFEQSNTLSGYGLAGMRDRAELGDGTFDIFSEKGQGTTVHVSLPCSSAAR